MLGRMSLSSPIDSTLPSGRKTSGGDEQRNEASGKYRETYDRDGAMEATPRYFAAPRGPGTRGMSHSYTDHLFSPLMAANVAAARALCPPSPRSNPRYLHTPRSTPLSTTWSNSTRKLAPTRSPPPRCTAPRIQRAQSPFQKLLSAKNRWVPCAVVCNPGTAWQAVVMD